MKLKRSKILAMATATLLVALTAVVAPHAARAGEPVQPRAALEGLIESATITASSSSTEDLFGSSDPHRVTSGVMFNVDLARPDVDAQPIEDGDTLDVRLVPEDDDQPFLKMDYQFSIKDEVVDTATSTTIADIDLSERNGFELTFLGIDDSFTAQIYMPMDLDTAALRVWFDNHPDDDEVTFSYRLVINGVKQDKVATFIAQRPAEGEVTENFDKSSGTYNQVGEFGEGYFMYNLWIDTELNQYNEYTVYDTPDVNLAFNGNLRLYVGRGHGEFTELTLDRHQNYWVEDEDNNKDTRMEVWLSDIYYLTEEGCDVDDPREASYTEEYLTYDRVNLATGVPYTQSMQQATVPENILVEVPAGTELTAEQQAKIDAAGGLNKTVGKGFKLRVKNFKGIGRTEGGFMTLVYYLDIVNPSPEMDANGIPNYRNTASLYAQEIPNCGNDEVCEPLEFEKTTMEDIDEGNTSTGGKVDPEDGTIGAEVDLYSAVDFQKLGRLSTEGDDAAEPLAGAVFTVYEAKADGSRGNVAVTRDGTRLENLVTNSDGRLCEANADGTAGEPIDVRVKRGNYLFVEVETPEDYTQPSGASTETLVTVGLFGNDVDVVNVAEPEPAPEKVLPQAYGLVAYEGGLGSHGDPETGDALPEPVWRAQWEGWTVTVDGEPWDIDAQGMPFNWGYFADGETDPADVITSAAGKGVYYLRAWPLDGDPEVIATDAQGKRYELGLEEGTATAINDPDGAPVVMKVRDVTNDANAEGLATATFRPVYASEHADSSIVSLARTVSAADGVFDENGTVAGGCESSSEPHAHVAEGTLFYKNGNELMPLNDDAKVNLLWDELQEGLLGGDERESKLDAKAREAAGGVFASDKNVGHEFKYMDLVDMEDGNVWVGTASEPTTVFWPYPEGVTAEDDVAVVRFPGLTRDYTIDQDAEELDAAIEACDAEVLAIEKTETGVLFEVPSCGFGPFELMWTSADEGDEPGGDQPGGGDEENPDDQNPGGDDENPDGGDESTDNENPGTNPGDNQPGSGNGTGTTNGSGSGSGTGDKGSGSLPTTGDPVTLAVIAAATASAGALGAGAVLKRRKR